MLSMRLLQLLEAGVCRILVSYQRGKRIGRPGGGRHSGRWARRGAPGSSLLPATAAEVDGPRAAGASRRTIMGKLALPWAV